MAFVDDDHDSSSYGQFSIQKIARLAHDEFNQEPGQWYSPNRIFYCIELCHEGKPDKPKSETKPKEKLERVVKKKTGTKDLKIKMIGTDSTLLNWN